MFADGGRAAALANIRLAGHFQQGTWHSRASWPGGVVALVGQLGNRIAVFVLADARQLLAHLSAVLIVCGHIILGVRGAVVVQCGFLVGLCHVEPDFGSGLQARFKHERQQWRLLIL